MTEYGHNFCAFCIILNLLIDVSVTKFYVSHFAGVPYKQADLMDPMIRHLLEKTAEVILDAGYTPSDLFGTNTGVFIGACFSETEKYSFYEKLAPKADAVAG